MSANALSPQRRSTAACAAGVAAVVYGAALALLAGAIALPIARAAGGEPDGPRNERQHGERDGGRPGADRRAHDNRQREERQRYEQQHYWQYQHPVYVPPPVYYYPPQASPGINLILPLELRSR